MSIITFANQKGGVAKTTSAVNVAHGAALRGYKTLLIDLDSQGNVADSLGLPEGSDLYRWLVDDEEYFQNCSMPSGRDRLDVIRSSKKTEKLKEILSSRNFRERILSIGLTDYEEIYDLVIFDCPPSVDIFQVAALVASDYLVVPTKLDQFAVKGVIEIIRSLDAVMRGTECHCKLAGILPTFFDRVTTESHQQLENLVAEYGNLVWPPIPVDNTCRVANRKGKTLFEMQTPSKAGLAYAEIIDRIVR